MRAMQTFPFSPCLSQKREECKRSHLKSIIILEHGLQSQGGSRVLGVQPSAGVAASYHSVSRAARIKHLQN